jgi:hypothetical protein
MQWSVGHTTAFEGGAVQVSEYVAATMLPSAKKYAILLVCRQKRLVGEQMRSVTF